MIFFGLKCNFFVGPMKPPCIGWIGVLDENLNVFCIGGDETTA